MTRFSFFAAAVLAVALLGCRTNPKVSDSGKAADSEPQKISTNDIAFANGSVAGTKSPSVTNLPPLVVPTVLPVATPNNAPAPVNVAPVVVAPQTLPMAASSNAPTLVKKVVKPSAPVLPPFQGWKVGQP